MNKPFLSLLFFICFIPLSAGVPHKCQLVDLFIGTAGDNGQVDPAACIPYGMVRVCPDMDPRSHTGYDYEINKISGFTVNRISGIGCSGAGGNLRLKPVLKEIKPNILKSTEKASPGYYTVTLENGVKVELTATNNIAVERFHYPEGAEAVLTLDLTAGFEKVRECSYKLISENEIEGFIRTGNTCNHGEYTLYFHMLTNKKFTVLSQSEEIPEIKFDNTDLQPVEVRLALSPINTETAGSHNRLISSSSFEDIHREAEKKWENILSRIIIKGASEEEEKLFYTCLYRIFLSPADVTSFDRNYRATDGSIQKAPDFTYYSSWSMWDSYRTKFPMITLVDPSAMKDICTSLCKLFIYGKKDWATDHESTPTVRTEHSLAVLLDAYSKGIPFDPEEAYEGFKKEIQTLQTQRPDQAFETCIDLWSMSRMATLLGHTTDAKAYAGQARELFLTTWEKDFQNIDDSFLKMRNNGLYQGTRWQYRWGVPQYLSLMSETSGGDNLLTEQLDYYYAHHLNNQTNEPGLHIPYLYNRLGEPYKCQQTVRKILTEEMTHLYGGNAEYPEPVVGKVFTTAPRGFLPEMDEDDGTMCAYYVFGTIGLYPLIVGEPWYEITSPLYNETILTLENNKKLTIKTQGRTSPQDPIKNITFNGNIISNFRINHHELITGGTLLIEY